MQPIWRVIWQYLEIWQYVYYKSQQFFHREAIPCIYTWDNVSRIACCDKKKKTSNIVHFHKAKECVCVSLCLCTYVCFSDLSSHNLVWIMYPWSLPWGRRLSCSPQYLLTYNSLPRAVALWDIHACLSIRRVLV